MKDKKRKRRNSVLLLHCADSRDLSRDDDALTQRIESVEYRVAKIEQKQSDPNSTRDAGYVAPQSWWGAPSQIANGYLQVINNKFDDPQSKDFYKSIPAVFDKEKRTLSDAAMKELSAYARTERGQAELQSIKDINQRRTDEITKISAGGSDQQIIASRDFAYDPKLAWGDHFRTVGVHDFPNDSQVWADGKVGWVVHTVLVSETGYFDSAADHVLRGGGFILRINEDYGRTIPTDASQYQAFAERWYQHVSALKSYIDSKLPSRHRSAITVVVGNEQNASGEWGGVEITPERYAQCFNVVYQALKRIAGVQVATGAIAWYGYSPLAQGNLHPRDYFVRMLNAINDLDAIAIHTYSHTNNASSVTSDNKFTQGLDDVHYDFQNYRDQMQAIPDRWKFVPVHITETNAGADLNQTEAWKDEDAGWITEAYKEIARWNADKSHQQIHSMSLFCFSDRTVGNQRYGFAGKWNVYRDFQRAQREADTRRYVPNFIPQYASWKYESQNAAGAWKYSADCGQTCVKMWLDWLNIAKNVTIDQLTDRSVRECGCDPRGYSNAYNLIALAGLYGVTAQVYEDPTPDAGDICLVDYSKINERADKNFRGLHWLIYLGDKDNKVVCHDPDYTSAGGAYREYDRNDFYGACDLRAAGYTSINHIVVRRMSQN